MKKMVLSLICSFLFCSAPSQAMHWSELETEIARVEDGQAHDPVLLARLAEMVQMLVVVTKTQAKHHSQAQLFCVPNKRGFEVNDIVRMIRESAARLQVDEKYLVQRLLLDGFMHNFPCD